MKLGKREQVSWMNIGDEATGAHLQAIVYNTAKVSSICPKQATLDINKCFVRWGIPKAIKIDNGYPFVNIGARHIPTLTQLWWIGLGIQVIKNKPACPQQNGIVENLQGTLYSWTNPKEQPTMQALQQRIDEESTFQRQFYRIPSKGYKTRMELYPNFENNHRIYRPELFDMQKIYNYLANQTWTATVRANGSLQFWKKDVYIGLAFKHQTVFISFDPIECIWVFRNRKGMLIKTSKKAIPQKEEILNFALMSKN